jgi:hypothetical protein
MGFAALAATLLLPSLHAFAPHATLPVESFAAAAAAVDGPAVGSATAAHHPASCPLCLAAAKLRSFLAERAAKLEACSETPPRHLGQRSELSPALAQARGAAAPRAPPA